METLKKIEHTLILHFKPTFIWVDLPNEQGDIHVVISCLRFNYLTIQERILDIYNLLNWKIPDILYTHLIVVEAYNSSEMDELLEEAFNEQ